MIIAGSENLKKLRFLAVSLVEISSVSKSKEHFSAESGEYNKKGKTMNTWDLNRITKCRGNNVETLFLGVLRGR